jgi:hypothetical protein
LSNHRAQAVYSSAFIANWHSLEAILTRPNNPQLKLSKEKIVNIRVHPSVIALPLVLAVQGPSVAQTISCDRDPAQFQCQVVDATPSGNHLLVQETRLVDGSVVFYIKSNLFNRQYVAGLHLGCTYYAEEGYVCSDPGVATSAQFVNVNGIELARFQYSSGRGTKTTLCGRNVPLDYNEGPIVNDVQFRREAVNESQTPGEFIFSGDPALGLGQNKTLIRSQGATALISQGSPMGPGFGWELTGLLDAPSLTGVRFGTVLCEGSHCGGYTEEGQRFSGFTQAFVLVSALGERLFKGGGSPPLVLLPNGSVDELPDFLCKEYPGMDPRPTAG